MNKNIYQWMAVAMLFSAALLSCNKYLDLQPKGKKILQTTTDYHEWLNSTSLAISMPNDLNQLTDEVDNPTIATPPSGIASFEYIWQPQFSVDVEATPPFWAKLYNNIYYYNTVLAGIDAAAGEESQKKLLKAEALLGRAFEYLYLVNLYGKPYSSSTAKEDLAVPFVTSNDLEKPVPPRSTVEDIYGHIIADVGAAISTLPAQNNDNRFRGSVAAGYSTLARAYLYMGNYPEAAQNAQLALDNGPNRILDYSTMVNPNNIAFVAYRSDVIYARLGVSQAQREIPALNFLKSFDKKDQRLKFFYTNLGDYSFNSRGVVRFQPNPILSARCHPNWGTTVAEMRLIIAEAAARANDLTSALGQLDSVRKCRFIPTDYIKFQSADLAEVLNKILAERTYEFAFVGLRWFDMRRLDAEGRMPEVKRFDGQGNLIATLPPRSNRYTLQIPMQVIYYNPEWPQNPE